MTVTIHAFYKFFPLPSHEQWRRPVLDRMNGLGIKGSILLASEGINGTVAGEAEAMRSFRQFLESALVGGPLPFKQSEHKSAPFRRAKVRLKKELISLGEDAYPARHVGTYVAPTEWNDLLSRDDVIVVDARNVYETHLGRFAGAHDPRTQTFSQLAAATRATLDPATHRKIATYCTGGIRCEKYTSWLLDQGFEEVYHLEGGILAYLAAIPPDQNRYEGSCYVFDERIALGHDLAPDATLTSCRNCGHPLTAGDRSAHVGDPGHCVHCAVSKAVA